MEVLLMEEIKLIGNLCLVQITRGGKKLICIKCIAETGC